MSDALAKIVSTGTTFDRLFWAIEQTERPTLAIYHELKFSTVTRAYLGHIIGLNMKLLKSLLADLDHIQLGLSWPHKIYLITKLY